MKPVPSSFPTHAGPVTLHYDPAITVARRNDPLNLTLPLRPEDTVDFRPVLDGRQFVVRYRDDCNSHQHYMFLGVDEQSSFITGVTKDAWTALDLNGEKAFFRSLTPLCINRLAKQFQSAPVGRQGDIHFLQLPYTWNEAVEHVNDIALDYWIAWCQKLLPAHKRRLFGTSHILRGRCVQNVIMNFDKNSFGGMTFGCGTLTAPDHAAVNLEGHPHILAQSRNIAPVTNEQHVRGWESTYN